MCLKANNETEPDALLCSINKRVSKHWKRHQTIQYDDLLFQLLFFIFFFELVKRFDDLWPFVFKFSGNCLKSLLMNRLRCLFLMQLNQTKVMMNHSKRRLNLKNSNSNRIVLYIKQGETQSILSSFRINLKNVLKEKKKQIQNVMFS